MMPSANLNHDVFVIIRSVGERTETACRNGLEKIFPSEHIATVKKTPFSEAIRESFAIAMQYDLPWTLCIDADVLVDTAQLPKLLQKTSKADRRIFEIQGLVLDKFISGWRPAGNHLYRTRLMRKAIPLIPEEGLSLRPESDMLTAMTRYGYPWMQCDEKIGIHDFEQYYEDIYRKCFLHAHKMKIYPFAPLLEPYWEEKSGQDIDYLVALMGWRSGKKYDREVFVDKNFLENEVKRVLKESDIYEKETLILMDVIEGIIEESKSNLFIHEYQETIFPSQYANRIVRAEPGSEKSNILKRMFHKLEDSFRK